VAPGDAEALAAAIGSLLRTPAQARSLARNGLARARLEFDWSAVMARNEALVARSLS